MGGAIEIIVIYYATLCSVGGKMAVRKEDCLEDSEEVGLAYTYDTESNPQGTSHSYPHCLQFRQGASRPDNIFSFQPLERSIPRSTLQISQQRNSGPSGQSEP